MARNTQCTCNTFCRVSQKSFGFYNISFEIWKGIALPYQNVERKSIFASYCNNILNHETKGHFKKQLFHFQYIILYILIQVNKGVAKLVTLVVEGHLNKGMEFKCNTCIVL